MKNIIYTLLAGTAITLLASCGGSDAETQKLINEKVATRIANAKDQLKANCNATLNTIIQQRADSIIAIRKGNLINAAPKKIDTLSAKKPVPATTKTVTAVAPIKPTKPTKPTVKVTPPVKPTAPVKPSNTTRPGANNNGGANSGTKPTNNTRPGSNQAPVKQNPNNGGGAKKDDAPTKPPTNNNRPGANK